MTEKEKETIKILKEIYKVLNKTRMKMEYEKFLENITNCAKKSINGGNI